MHVIFPQGLTSEGASLRAEAQAQTTESFPDYLEVLKRYVSDNPNELWTGAALAGLAGSSAFVRSTCLTHPNIYMTLGALAACFAEGGSGPVSIVFYRTMLYPDSKTYLLGITPEVLEWLKQEAIKLLYRATKGELKPSADVKAHWESLVAGVAPFGLPCTRTSPPYI